MSDTPIYSDLEEIQDSDRRSFSEAPEAQAGGIDNFKREFASEASRRQRGAFGRGKPEPPDAELPPIDHEDLLLAYRQNADLRDKVAAYEYEFENQAEDRLDGLAAEEYETREEYAAVLDELLQAGGGPRMRSLLLDWAERDPAGAEAWRSSREYAATQATAAASTQAVQAEQAAVEAEFAKVLNDFQAKHPETKVGGLEHEAIAAVLANDPDAWASPTSFARSLEEAYAQETDAMEAVQKSANEMAFRQAFRQEALRVSPMHPPTPEHLAQMAARPLGPQSIEELHADAAARLEGSRAQRAARVEARNEEFRDAFAEASRSKFSEGNREGAARAKEAQVEGWDGHRPGVF